MLYQFESDQLKDLIDNEVDLEKIKEFGIQTYLENHCEKIKQPIESYDNRTHYYLTYSDNDIETATTTIENGIKTLLKSSHEVSREDDKELSTQSLKSDEHPVLSGDSQNQEKEISKSGIDDMVKEQMQKIEKRINDLKKELSKKPEVERDTSKSIFETMGEIFNPGV